MSKPPAFYFSKTVKAYKAAVAQRDTATTQKAKTAAEKTISRLRAEWIEWNGGDANELHEVDFGG
jgi:hypothetical protein